MTRLQGALIAAGFAAVSGLAGAAQPERTEILVAAIDTACETARSQASAGGDHWVAVRGSEQARLNEYLSLHAEIRHDSGVIDAMPWPAPRLQAN